MGVIGCFDNSYKISDVLIYCQEKLPTPKRRPVPQAPENFDKVTSHRGNIVSLYLLFMIKGDQRGDEGQGPGQDEPEGLRRLQRHRADVLPLVQQVRHTARFTINYLCRLCS